MKNLSRRNFIYLSASGAIATPFLSKGLMDTIPGEEHSGDSQEQFEKPVFRFLQINDLHIQSGNSRYRPKSGSTYKNANARGFWLMEAISNNFFPPLDFVLAIGDMVNGESLEGIKYDLDFFHRHFVSQLPVPFYPVVGNHENKQQEGNPVNEGPYTQIFGKDKLNYSFVHKGIHFIVLNNSGTWNINDSAILDQWLLIRVPSDLLEPSTNIHGAGRFGIDYRDGLHPDYTTYIMGNESERRFTIPIIKS